MKMEEITISKELLKQIIADDYIDGETWGITHHTWFTPSNSETSNKIDSSIKKALRKIKSKTPPNPETK